MKKIDSIQKDVIKLWKALLKLESHNRNTDPVFNRLEVQISKGLDSIFDLRRDYGI